MTDMMMMMMMMMTKILHSPVMPYTNFLDVISAKRTEEVNEIPFGVL